MRAHTRHRRDGRRRLGTTQSVTGGDGGSGSKVAVMGKQLESSAERRRMLRPIVEWWHATSPMRRIK